MTCLEILKRRQTNVKEAESGMFHLSTRFIVKSEKQSNFSFHQGHFIISGKFI